MLVQFGAQDFLVKGQYDETLLTKSIEYSMDRFKSRKTIENNEKHFREIIEKNPDGMIVVSGDNTILYINPVAEKMLDNNINNLLDTRIRFPLEIGKAAEEEFADKTGKVKIFQIKVVEANWDSKKAKIATLRDITELKQNENKIVNLNSLLGTIQKINHLIVNEKNLDKLLNTACSLLVEGRNYRSAWIGLYNDKGEISEVYSKELDDKHDKLVNYIDNKNELYCHSEVSKCNSVVQIPDLKNLCGGCPLADNYSVFGAFSIEIRHKGIKLGILTVSRSMMSLNVKVESALLDEAAHDIGLALHAIKMEKLEIESQKKIKWLNQAIHSAANAIVLTDTDANIKWINPAFSKLTGYNAEEVLGKNPRILKSNVQSLDFYQNMWNTITAKKTWNGQIVNKKKDGTLYTEEMTITPVINSKGDITQYISIKADISDRKIYESKLNKAYKLAQDNASQTEALLEAAKSILEFDDFEESAKKIFEYCSKSIGTKSGYIALISKDGSENIVLFLESGGLDWTIDRNLSMPITELREKAYKSGEVVFENDFMNSEWINFIPEGHVDLKNVMFAPLIINNKVEGIIGLANKNGDFTEKDAQIAKGFGELAAIALKNTQSREKIIESEEKHRLLAENSIDLIWQLDKRLKFTYLSPGLERMTGFKQDEWIGTHLWKHATFKEFMKMGRLAVKAISEAKKDSYFVFETKMLNKENEEFPVEISSRLLFDENENIIGLQGTTRDITERIAARQWEDKNREIFEQLYLLSKMVNKPSDQIMGIALEKAIALTESEGGALIILDDKTISLELFDWPKQTMKVYRLEKDKSYPIENSEIWIDCVRQRKAVIHNDFKEGAGKICLPNAKLGQFKINKYLSIPVFDGEKIVAVCCVGNKKENYTEDDSLILSLLLNEMWKLVARNKSVETIKENEERFRSIYENANIGIFRAKESGEILMMNPAMIKILGYPNSEGPEGLVALTFYKYPDHRTEFINILKSEGFVKGFETVFVKMDGAEIDVRLNARGIKVENEIILEGVLEDITARKETEKALIYAKDQAEKSDKLKGEFLAQMSHEIRTPLNAILSASSFLSDEFAQNKDEIIIESFEIIEFAGQRLIRTIESIINMSDLNTGTYEPIINSINLRDDILAGLEKEFLFLAAEKKLDFSFIYLTENLIINADEYSLIQIFKNLLDNAIKYTNEGKVEVRVSRNKNKLEVEVSDSGIGMSEEFLQNLFLPFSQEEQGYTRKYDGNGLGLALVKRYSELNNAEIKVESEKGIGTTFKIIFK